MSSQGSSSAKAASGTAFGPMSGDPLYRVVSTPNASSSESVPEVASCRREGEVAEPEREAASTSGRQADVEGEEEVAVSCGDLASQVTGEECTRITRLYSLNVSEPTDLERPHTPPEGHVTLSETYLRFRMRFPLNLFFVVVLKHYGLTVFQITPNGWAHMIGLFGLFAWQSE